MSSRSLSSTLLAIAWSLATAPAAAQHLDLLIAQDGESLHVGSFDWGTSVSEIPVYVHYRALEETGEDYAAGKNPGFNSVETPPAPFEALPAEVDVSFDFIAAEGTPGNLFRWDGDGPVEFEALEDAESMLWATRDGRSARVEGTQDRVEGFVLATTSELGVMHEHIDLVLLGADADAPMSGGEPPRPGIYGVAVEFEIEIEGLAASRPAFVLLQHGDVPKGRLEEAASWVDAQWVEGEDHDFTEDVGSDEVDDCGATGDGRLGAGLVNHARFHADYGPFEDVQGARTREVAPDASEVHTYYTVGFPEAELACVAYQPARSGTWAVFTNEDVPYVLQDADERVLDASLRQEVPGCPALPHASVYTLKAGAEYTLCFEASDATEVGVVIEKLSDFETRYGLDGDGDGFGSMDETVTTPCVTPEGYVPGADDCDDDDPEVHPEAEEMCDEVDRDCDGEPGSGHATCDVADADGGAADAGGGDADGGAEDGGAQDGGAANEDADDDAAAVGSGGCTSSPSAPGAGTWALWLGAALLMSRGRRTRRLLGGSLLFALATPRGVFAEHVDIMLAERDGRVETGAYDFGKARGVMPQAAFERAFEIVEEDHATGNDPGFNSVLEPPEPWWPLPPEVPVSIRAAREAPRLTYWDGSDPVRFELAPEEVWFEVAKTGLFGVLESLEIDAAGSPSEPFEFTRTDSSGTLHEHLQLSVFDADGDAPPPGMYCAGVNLAAGDLDYSPAAYLLLFDGMEASDAARAARCVEDYLVPDCDDGFDNDGDGRTDLEDEGCTSAGDLSEQPDCADGIDDDHDGLVDSEDPECEGDPAGASECDPCGAPPDEWTCLGALPESEMRPSTGGDAVADETEPSDGGVEAPEDASAEPVDTGMEGEPKDAGVAEASEPDASAPDAGALDGDTAPPDVPPSRSDASEDADDDEEEGDSDETTPSGCAALGGSRTPGQTALSLAWLACALGLCRRRHSGEKR